jgi:RNA polymerase sigma-70 factor (ECF subfamily)
MCQSYETLALIEFMDRLYSYAMVLTQNADDAQGILEDTYVRAVANISHLGPDSNIAGWLATILRNVWCNQVRDRDINQRPASVDVKQSLEDSLLDTAKGPYEICAGNAVRDRVHAAIQQLPTEFREVILLREFEELSYREIADIVGCKIGTVMSRLARARSRLHILLDDIMPTGITRSTKSYATPEEGVKLCEQSVQDS